MSIKGKWVIYVGPADGARDKPLYTEGKAVTAITPGMVLKETASGLEVNDISATTFGEQLIVADKNRLQTKSVDEDWTIDGNMVAILPRSGEFINIRFNGSAINKGEAVSRDAVFGILGRAVTPATVDSTSEEIVGFSDETMGDGDSMRLIRIRIA